MKNEDFDENKETRLLNTAFKLFTEKGIKDTSIQEIVDNASVAKGTFYLYFKDKYEIRDILIAKKSHKLSNIPPISCSSAWDAKSFSCMPQPVRSL